MRISVGGKLERILSGYRPEPDALIEFNISEHGLDVVANGSGWKSLARWCLVMAHPELDQARELDITEGPISDDMFVSGRAIMAFSGLAHSGHDQGIRFRQARCIGDQYWGESHPTGNSPRTWAADAVLLRRLESVVGLAIEDARNLLGRHLGCVGHEHYFELSPAADSGIDYLMAGRHVWVLVDEDGLIRGVGVADEADVEDLLSASSSSTEEDERNPGCR